MQRRLIIVILLIICVLSGITFFSVLQYVDPYERTILAIFSLILSFLLSFSSLITMSLYFFKKIYYR